MSAETNITAIQVGIETVLDTISGLKVRNDAPKTIPLSEMPCVMTYLAGPEQDEWETGGGTDNRYRFTISLLVGHDRDIGAAMIAHGAWVGKILDALRASPKLNDSCDMHSISDGGEPTPIEDGSKPYVVKRLYVTARTTES